MAFPSLVPVNGDSDNILQGKIARSAAINLGAYGANTYNAPGDHDGEWQTLTAIQDSQVKFARDGVVEIVFLTAGRSLFGKFTTVNALTGVIEVYKAS